MPIYNLLVRLYGFAIFMASIRKTKAKQWVQGRKKWRKTLAQKTKTLSSQKRIWVHCASYGEFEQGRPLIEAIKKKHPDYAIVLTFFSPSGYEAFKNWPGADVISYLPLDTKRNARDFIDLIQPQAVLFIKYEFWINFLFRLKKQNVPTFLVSAVFKPHHPFFKWYGTIFRDSLKTFSRLFIQDEGSAKLLEEIGMTNYEICGDTRFDRVMQIKENFTAIDFFENYCRNKQVLVAGSTWPKDEEFLLNVFQKLNNPDFRLILVPHHVDAKSIQHLEALLNKRKLSYQLYSQGEVTPSKNILVLNTMGLLNKIYHYAHITYVGGGFNSGIHNCLEPAVYLKPVIFGAVADYSKFNEAMDLVAMDAARPVTNEQDVQQAILHYLNTPSALEETEMKLKAYFEKKSGTTDKVLDFINWD